MLIYDIKPTREYEEKMADTNSKSIGAIYLRIIDLRDKEQRTITKFTESILTSFNKRVVVKYVQNQKLIYQIQQN